MSGVEPLEARVRVLLAAARQPLTVPRERLAQRAFAPARRQRVGLAVGEKQPTRVRVCFAHHVDRIVQQRLAQPRGRRRHEHRCARLPAHEHGQAADVVEVRVRDEDGVERRAVRGWPEVGQGGVAVALRVHPAIEHDAPAAIGVEFEQVTVRADLGGAGEVGETHGGKMAKDECRIARRRGRAPRAAGLF